MGFLFTPKEAAGNLKRLTLIIIGAFLLFSISLTAHEEANFWFFGEYAGLDFSSGRPRAITNGALGAMEGVAAISNSAGQLLFYTNGMSVWNKDNVLMINGTGLTGHNSATQSGVIVPKPGSNSIFYIFTVDEVGGANGFRYSTVDMSLQNGMGELTEKNILLHVPTTEKVTAVMHTNNRDIWVISHQWNTDGFYSYLVTENGIITVPHISFCGAKHAGNIKNAIGYLKASPTGEKLAHAIRDMDIVELFDFDRRTGRISNAIAIKHEYYRQPYGIEFSPDGLKLYVSYSRPESSVIQYDMNYLPAKKIYESASAICEEEGPNVNFALQIGPDRKIYIAKYNKTYLGVIEEPNKEGADCLYNENGVSLGGRVCNLGLPTFVQSFFLRYNETVDSVTYDVPLTYPKDFSPGVPVITSDSVSEGGIVKLKYDYHRTDTLYLKKNFPLSASIKAVGIDENGKNAENPAITIEEFYTNRLHPLLNYIFFEENSSVLNGKYFRLTSGASENFDLKKLNKFETLVIYYNLLNIIGKRMRDNPGSKITITGCNSGVSAEKNNTPLSRARSETIRDYLYSVWEIKPERMLIVARNIPENPSIPLNETDKAAENRRVEIESDNPIILAPVFTSDTIRKVNYDILRIYTSLDSKAGIEDCRVAVKQGQRLLDSFSGKKGRASSFDFNLEEADKSFSLDNLPLEVIMSITDKYNQKLEIPPKIVPLRHITLQHKSIQKIEDKEIDEYSLILFSFNESMLTESHKRITDMIRQRIMPGSIVKIFGFTDRTGQEDFNLELSEKRAERIRDALGTNYAGIFGNGEEELLYNNDLPEGRFYCRTVKVILETPFNR